MKNYRIHTISRIPTLKVLDFQKVKQQEREEAKKYLETLEANQKNDANKIDKRKILKAKYFKIFIFLNKCFNYEGFNRKSRYNRGS